MSSCPCASGKEFGACCGPFLSGEAVPPNPEALMRSRYSAFAVGNIDYLESTLLPGTGEDFDRAQVTDWARNSEWTGLEIRATEGGGPDDDAGMVEFVARFRTGGKDYVHHETSRFARQDGRWWYVEGSMGPRQRVVGPKVGRNDPCPCGSGKKHKKCCGAAA
ncbi:YchJ family protein [Arenibaculum pallidiluteum]|uniref:YchJ family protein n=1 Tax=Arenibaculum pallidiluteum TaxID=2812559 RepID=UPI001A961D0D|nr:YchJ family protein [Arenibaculum pallidiluteum]